MSQQSSARKSCSQLEIQCVIDISPKFTDTEAYFHSNSVAARISQLECKIEALLCQLPGRQPKSMNDSLSTVGEMNVKKLEYLALVTILLMKKFQNNHLESYIISLTFLFFSLILKFK